MKLAIDILLPLFPLALATWLAFENLGVPLGPEETTAMVAVWAVIVLAVRYFWRLIRKTSRGRVG